MAQFEVTCRLDGVTDGVAQVERLATPVLPLVRVDHVALDLDVSGNNVHELVGVKAGCAHGVLE